MCIIRKFDPKDKQQVTKLWIDICVDEYGFKEWKKELEIIDDFENLLVAELDDVVVGTIAYQPYDDETAEIKRLYVNSNCRGLGIANKLLDSIIDEIKEKGYTKLYLETWKQLESGRRFYEKNGFVLRDIQDELRYHYIRNI
ncbi:MAG: GNAT family N-acetyltransferase [Clostridia bacterium]|nr:GNAT family N-acetyltransferase [Clostridia bacterium]